MTIADGINGLYEAAGSLAIWLNVRAILRDKQIKGIHIAPMIFFTSWSFWNLYYYPHLQQWLSFAGGVSIVAANTVWTGLALYFGRKKSAREIVNTWPAIETVYPAEHIEHLWINGVEYVPKSGMPEKS